MKGGIEDAIANFSPLVEWRYAIELIFDALLVGIASCMEVGEAQVNQQSHSEMNSVDFHNVFQLIMLDRSYIHHYFIHSLILFIQSIAFF